MENRELMAVAIFSIILVLTFLVHYTRFFLLEYRVIKRLLNFDTVEEGVKSLGIAEEMVKSLQKNNDILYSTRISLICVKRIKYKLFSMGYTESEGEKR